MSRCAARLLRRGAPSSGVPRELLLLPPARLHRRAGAPPPSPRRSFGPRFGEVRRGKCWPFFAGVLAHLVKGGQPPAKKRRGVVAGWWGRGAPVEVVAQARRRRSGLSGPRRLMARVSRGGAPARGCRGCGGPANLGSASRGVESLGDPMAGGASLLPREKYAGPAHARSFESARARPLNS